MKLATKAYVITLILLTLVFAASAQQRSDKDDRNTAPTVGTGGPVGGPTGLFTVYDGQTLRKGEYTFSAAYSNYDRDPGDVDISSIPLSFQVGVNDNVELFFGTEAYRGVHVNAPRNLSGFYLPNSRLTINGVSTTGPAITLGTGVFANTAVFRRTGAPGAFYPFTGPGFGTPTTGGSAGVFPGLGSPFGGILPGVVLQTSSVVISGTTVEVPTVFTLAPSYLPDAPFINRTWGTSSFNSLDFGAKWRMNDNQDAVGYGLIASYRWYLDRPDDFAGFNMLQRGAGPGASKGDINLTFFTDARLTEHINLSGNIGYTYTTNPKLNDITLLDRPDELLASIGADFPVNKYLQYILEFRALKYVAGHTPNAFERDPIDGLFGIRVFPRRWWGFGAAYRANLNQQSGRSFDEDETHTTTVNVGGTPIVTTFTGAPPGFQTSTGVSGFIGQVWVGRREPRQGPIPNLAANVDAVALSTTVITLPCAPGFRPRAGGVCDDNRTISVATRASDPENDVLTYNYTVSGGRIIGTGANVQWDMSGVTPGTYTITTGVNDGCGICGKTNTQTITVRECDCEAACSCPTLTVDGPSGLTTPGQPMTFTASVSGGDVTYNWTVSSGTISSGQGTSSITVDTTGLAPGTNVTATVEIGGVPTGCGCPTSASATGSIPQADIAREFDTFGNLKPDDIKARIDNFFVELNQNPNAQGYIINYGTPAQIKARRAVIMKAINRPGTGYDPSRVTFIDGTDTGEGVKTRLFIVPAGATPPTP
jgi:hypothetical protein